MDIYTLWERIIKVYREWSPWWFSIVLNSNWLSLLLRSVFDGADDKEVSSLILVSKSYQLNPIISEFCLSLQKKFILHFRLVKSFWSPKTTLQICQSYNLLKGVIFCPSCLASFNLKLMTNYRRDGIIFPANLSFCWELGLRPSAIQIMEELLMTFSDQEEWVRTYPSCRNATFSLLSSTANSINQPSVYYLHPKISISKSIDEEERGAFDFQKADQKSLKFQSCFSIHPHLPLKSWVNWNALSWSGQSNPPRYRRHQIERLIQFTTLFPP